MSALSDTIERERIEDAKRDLTDLLEGLVSDTGHMVKTLRRVHGDACTCEPVTAMVILPLIEQAEKTHFELQRLATLRG